MALMNDYALTLGIKYSYYNLCLHIPNDRENFCNNSRFLFSGIVIKMHRVHCSKYEHVWDRQVYSIQFHCTLYSLQQIVDIYKLQVYSTLDSLRQIFVTYKSLTNQWAITLIIDIRAPNIYALMHCWQSVFNQSEIYYTFVLLIICPSTNQSAITLLLCCLANQWAITLFALFTCTRKALFGIYYTVVNGA